MSTRISRPEAAACNLGSGTVVSLWNMLKFNFARFYTAISNLRDIKDLIEKPGTPDAIISGEIRTRTMSNLKNLLIAFSQLGASNSLAPTKRLYNAFNDGEEITHRRVLKDVTDIDARLRDELSSTYLYILDSKQYEYYNPAQPIFEELVVDKFPQMSAEIAEAGRCFGLGRYTACVFHLMRVVESGLNAIRDCMGLLDPLKEADRNWGAILRNIRKEIDNKSKWNDQKDKVFFNEVYASIDAIRNVWRNSTMHVENTYSRDDAELILNAVRGFIKKLATRMDGVGLPRA